MLDCLLLSTIWYQAQHKQAVVIRAREEHEGEMRPDNGETKRNLKDGGERSEERLAEKGQVSARDRERDTQTKRE